MVEFDSLDTVFKLLGSIISYPPVFLGVMLIIVFLIIKGKLK